ncbi:MAG: class I SAM-dependent methyltransferase [Pseudomonadota bacterium]
MASDQQEKTAKTFDSYQSSYSDTVNDAVSFTGLDVDFFTRVKAGYIRDVVQSVFGAASGVNALDLGCGVGNLHGLLRPDFKSLTGVDVSQESIATARKTHPDVTYDIYDGTRLPYGDAQFDVAFTICVMHHVPVDNWPGFVAEMKRVLKPGGLALVFEHNPRNPLTMRAVNTCPFDADAVLLRSHETEALFMSAGFSAVKTRFILSVPSATKSLRRIDRLFSRLPFGAQYYMSARNP